MEIICKERGQDKTYNLILESAKMGIPILTAYNSRYIVDQAKRMGVKILQPISVQEYKNLKKNNYLLNSKDWKGKLLIDDVDKVLEQLLETHVEKVTCTPDNYFKNQEDNFMNNNFYFEPWNPIESSLRLAQIKDVKVIVPNKVVEVTFLDGIKEKSVCKESDVFSLETAISICISKRILGGSSAYNNAVRQGMKVYEDKLKKESADKAEQKRIEKKREKRLAYKERRNAKRIEEENQRKKKEREEQIEIQKEAYLRAMKELNTTAE